jgi:pectinesterase
MVTAQGRTDPNQNAGISIKKCDIIASSDLQPVKGSFKSYLGRSWKEYSRTAIMQSNNGESSWVVSVGRGVSIKDFVLR